MTFNLPELNLSQLKSFGDEPTDELENEESGANLTKYTFQISNVTKDKRFLSPGLQIKK